MVKTNLPSEGMETPIFHLIEKYHPRGEIEWKTI